MAEILFVSKPVAPPWNDSSKNLVRDIAAHLRRNTPVLMGRAGEGNPIGAGRVVGVYGNARSAPFAPTLGSNLRVFGHLIGSSPADVWHFFFAPNRPSSTAARLAKAVRGVPTVQTVCSMPSEGVRLEKLLFADLTVLLSRSSYDRFRAAVGPQESLRLIPPSVPPLNEPGPEDRARLRVRHALPASAAICIYPGDLELGGGADVTLRGFAGWNRSDALLLMACRNKTTRAPEAQARLQAQARRLSIEHQVRWVGETSAIHELLALSDLVMLPNPSAYAKMDYPLAALEAMCMARPVIVASGTPAAELSDEGGAVAVEPSGDALAEVIERLADDEDARLALGRRAREITLRRFSPVGVAAAYEGLYEELHG